MSAGWKPPACNSSCLSCEPKNLNHGRRAKALPITIAETPYQCKTGAGAKRHQYNNRAGTNTKHRRERAAPASSSTGDNARARVFLPAQRSTEVKGECACTPKTSPDESATQLVSHRVRKRRTKYKTHRGAAPEKHPPKTHDEHAQPGRTQSMTVIGGYIYI